MRLLMARGEFAEARSARMLRSLSDEAAQLRLDGRDQALLDCHAFRSRTMLTVERLLQQTYPDDVILGEALDRYATLAAIASEAMVELRSSIACLLVGPELCRWIMCIAAEVVHAIESSADRNVGCRAMIGVEHEEGIGVVMRITSLGGLERPVPTSTGLAALERTSRIMGLFGGFRKEVHGSNIVYVATFAGCTANEID
jgi:hypothetical protein